MATFFNVISSARQNLTYYAGAAYDLYERSRQNKAIGDEAALVHPSHVNDTNSSHETLLQRASRIGNAGAVRTLLDKGANYQKSDNHTDIPFFLAAHEGHIDVMRLLIDVQAMDGLGNTHPPSNFPAGTPAAFDVLMTSPIPANVYSTASSRFFKAKEMVEHYVQGKDPSPKADIEKRLSFLIEKGIDRTERRPLNYLITQAIEQGKKDQQTCDMLQFLCAKNGGFPPRPPLVDGEIDEFLQQAINRNHPLTATFIQKKLYPEEAK